MRRTFIFRITEEKMFELRLISNLQGGIPVVTFPHIAVTLTLLSTRVRRGYLRQIELPYLTFPERHRKIFRPIRIKPSMKPIQQEAHYFSEETSYELKY